MFSSPRIFLRVVAAIFAFGWVLYVVSGGVEALSALGLATIIPVLLAVIVVWAAVVEEEGILWTMCVGLVLFGVGFLARGALAIVFAGIGMMIVAALTKDFGAQEPTFPESLRRQIR